MRIEHVPSIDSTNSELMRRAAASDYSTVCLVAKEQMAGRGRLGRAWLSDQDSLTLSIGTPLKPIEWSGLSLAIGVSVAESLHEKIQIKWPNDLWVDGKKLAGILIETTPMKGCLEGERYAVIGIGINLNAPTGDAIKNLRTLPIGLRELEPSMTPEQALAQILQPLTLTLQIFEAQGYAPFAQRFSNRDALTDKSITLSSGMYGQYRGISGQGALMLQTEMGMQMIVSHEVSECL